MLTQKYFFISLTKKVSIIEYRMWQVKSSDRGKEDPLFDSPLLRVDVTATKKPASLLVTASRSQQRRQWYTFVKTLLALNRLRPRFVDVSIILKWLFLQP